MIEIGKNILKVLSNYRVIKGNKDSFIYKWILL